MVTGAGVVSIVGGGGQTVRRARGMPCNAAAAMYTRGGRGLGDRERCRLTPPYQRVGFDGCLGTPTAQTDRRRTPLPPTNPPTGTEHGRRHSRRAPVAARVCSFGVCTLVCAIVRSGCVRSSFSRHSTATDRITITITACTPTTTKTSIYYLRVIIIIIIIIIIVGV